MFIYLTIIFASNCQTNFRGIALDSPPKEGGFYRIVVEDAHLYYIPETPSQLSRGDKTEPFHSSSATYPAVMNLSSLHPSSKQVSYIGDQGSCGSCWTFGTSDAAGTSMYIFTEGTTDIDEQMSPQDLVTCDNSCFSSDPPACQLACDGGYPVLAAYFIETRGITTLSCKAYTSGSTIVPPCRTKCDNGDDQILYNKKNTHVVSYYFTDKNAVTMFETAMLLINTYGSFVYQYQVPDDFASFFASTPNGIYSIEGPIPENAGHAVSCVGYGVTEQGQKYYLLKNSWGSHWGDQGYFRMAATKNICSSEEMFVFFQAEDASFLHSTPCRFLLCLLSVALYSIATLIGL